MLLKDLIKIENILKHKISKDRLRIVQDPKDELLKVQEIISEVQSMGDMFKTKKQNSSEKKLKQF